MATRDSWHSLRLLRLTNGVAVIISNPQFSKKPQTTPHTLAARKIELRRSFC
jgi:hypothetical protein